MDTFIADSTTRPIIYSCSPRPGGNSDHAAELFSQGVVQAGGAPQHVFLRQYKVTPCLGCHRCDYDQDKRCFLTPNDQSGPLFQTLQSAPMIHIASPIYYYHLPAMFKAFIDRGQAYFLRVQNRDPELLSLPPRKAYVTLVAGQTRGEMLFKGALLTLKYFFNAFRISLAEPLLLRGLDGPKDLAEHGEAHSQILEYGRNAWMETKQQFDIPDTPASSDTPAPEGDG